MGLNYTETIDWLFSRLPMYQRVGTKAIKKDLNNIRKFCNHLDNPQDKFRSIHIAGTNGKGSTSHMMASVLQEAGYKVGLHTSPHLKDFRERTRINGKMMSKAFVIDFVQKHKTYIDDLHASFFEVSVAMGFQYLAENEVDIAIIETGLGGRLDSTNIVKPIVSIITNIGKDHTAVLGTELSDIAKEKAGIIKSKVPVIIGRYTSDTKYIFENKAKDLNAGIYFVQDETLTQYTTDLKGLYQLENVKTATKALQVLKDFGFSLTKEHFTRGFNNVQINTQIRGRWDVLQTKPLIIADTAHNPDGINYVIQQIADTPYRKLHIVLGFVNDKDVSNILSKFPKDAQFYFSAPNVPRKLEVESLKQIVPKTFDAKYYSSINEALIDAKMNAHEEDLIYIGGSTFVVAEVI